jgi:hypothetical protein
MATEAPDVEIRVGNATAGVNTNTKDLERESMAAILRGLQASLTGNLPQLLKSRQLLLNSRQLPLQA